MSRLRNDPFAETWKYLNVRACAVLMLAFVACPTAGWTMVPLPKPRPPGALQQAPSDRPDAAPLDADQTPDPQASDPQLSGPQVPGSNGMRTKTGSAEPSPCRVALSEEIAVAPSVPPIRGPGECGGEDLVRLEAVVLNGGQRVSVKPAAVLRCTMASAIADWVRTDLTTLATGLGSVPSELDNFDSYECRGRNRIVGAKLSEHGKANALDVRGVKLATGKFISLTDRTEPRELREQVLHSVCARFSTVLGPGSDWYHEDHIHLDLAERRSHYRTCQWGVYDPLPAIAPLLPAVRPDDAPPRQEAGGQDEQAAPQQPGAATEPEAVEPEAADPPPPAKRRKDRRLARPAPKNAGN
jgi:hypothetical protein